MISIHQRNIQVNISFRHLEWRNCNFGVWIKAIHVGISHKKELLRWSKQRVVYEMRGGCKKEKNHFFLSLGYYNNLEVEFSHLKNICIAC